MVLNVQRHSGAFVNTSTKFWKRKGCGQRCDDRACWFVIRAVSVMNTNGARNAIAAAISRLWFATASSSRLRLTRAGGRRRTKGLGSATVTGAAVVVVNAAPPGAPTYAS